MGLKRLSGRAMATLVIAANIPDIDAAATMMGTESLSFRRGITHGPIALALLPLLLTGLMLAYNRWRPSREAVRPGPLLLAAYIGTLSHPALDWLNSYGIRLLEPFSNQWFAGDTLFIIDIWIWAILLVSFFLSRRRERQGGDGRGVAWTSFAAIGGYIFANGLFTGSAEQAATEQLRQRGVTPALVVANPVPGKFWERKLLWRDAANFGNGRAQLLGGIDLASRTAPLNLEHPALAAADHRPDVRAFLFWSRMPIVAVQQGKAVLTDQRFTDLAELQAASEPGTSFRSAAFTVPLE